MSENVLISLTALGASIIGISGTLLGVHLSNKSNIERQKRERNIQNLEELYLLINKYCDTLVMHWLPYMKVMKQQISYNDALDLTISRDKNDINYYRIEMLINYYIHSIKPNFQIILDARERVNEILQIHKSEYKNGILDGSRFIEAIQNETGLISEQCSVINQALAAQIKEHI